MDFSRSLNLLTFVTLLALPGPGCNSPEPRSEFEHTPAEAVEVFGYELGSLASLALDWYDAYLAETDNGVALAMYTDLEQLSLRAKHDDRTLAGSRMLQESWGHAKPELEALVGLRATDLWAMDEGDRARRLELFAVAAARLLELAGPRDDRVP